MARQPSQGVAVGETMRLRRMARGWSVRHAADRAGISHSTWSRIERGLLSADNRFVLAAIAEALECSTTDLTGRAPIPADLETATAQAGVVAILNVLVETDLAEPPTCTPRPLPEIAQDAELIWDLRLNCEYSAAAKLLPRVLRELHASTQGSDRRGALALLTRTADACSFVMRYVGYPSAAWLASDRARDAAAALEDPVLLGLSAWSLGHAATGCGAYARALRIAEAGVRDLEPHADTAQAPEMLAQLQMLAGYSHLALGRRDDALAHARDYDAIATRIGDVPTLGLNFGPTNGRMWRISMEVDGGEPGRAVEIARATNPAAVTVSRQAAFYADTGRALARVGKDVEAVRMLLTAERLAPQRIRSSPVVRETTRSLFDRARRRAGGAELRGLVERMGMLN